MLPSFYLSFLPPVIWLQILTPLKTLDYSINASMTFNILAFMRFFFFFEQNKKKLSRESFQNLVDLTQNNLLVSPYTTVKCSLNSHTH